MTGDWKASTFVLSAEDVARALGVSLSTVTDMMLAGALGFWIPPSTTRRTAVPLTTARFDPADVDAYRTAKPLPEVESSVAILENLHAYLASFDGPVTTDYEAAVRLGAPLLAREHLYVRSKSLTAFAAEHDAPIGAQLRQTTETVLASVGAVRQRGIRPDGDERQRWAYWWRLPDAIAADGRAPALTEFLRARGALAEHEVTVTAPDGEAVVDGALTPDKDDWT